MRNDGERSVKLIDASLGLGLLRVQPVWKRFSYPNEYKQPGVKDLDATI